jgi:hypothetical protein
VTVQMLQPVDPARDFADRLIWRQVSSGSSGITQEVSRYACLWRGFQRRERWALAGYIRSLTFAPDQELLQLETPPPRGRSR